jgi:hypothetical protein
MKRLFLALFVLTALAVNAQKSVLLRANYTTGDKYVITMEQIQNMGLQGGINMNVTMSMEVGDVGKEEIKTKSQIKAIKMDMLQGGMEMSYDSSKSDDELDEAGRAVKAQVAPMMKSVITTTIDPLGKTLNTAIDPPNPTMEQFSSQTSSIVFPEEKVSVGSSWSSEDENMGMKMKMVFTVAKIENGTVYIDISGDVSGMGEGTIKGKTEIDVKTGIQTLLENEVSVKAMGQEVKVTSKVYMKKA